MSNRFIHLLLVLAALMTGESTHAQCLDWRTFPYNPPEVGGFPRQLLVHDDGSGPALYFTGYVTDGNFGGGILRWNGTSFSPFAFPGVWVDAAVSFDDGTGPALYAAVWNGSAEAIMKWDGTSWTQIGAMGNAVLVLGVHDDGTGPALYAAGRFGTVNSMPIPGVAKWNGVTWSALGNGPPTNGDNIFGLASYDDGTGPALIVVGDFGHTSSSPNIAKWQNGAWSGVGGGTNAAIRAVAAWDDGTGPSLFVAGLFTSPAASIARWDGTTWHPVGGGVPPYPQCMRVLDNGSGNRLFVGFQAPSSPQPLLASVQSWNGSSWSQVGPLPITGSFACFTSAFVAALAVFDEGAGPHLFAATQSGALGDVWEVLSRLNGNAWERVDSEEKGLHGTVRVTQVHDDGSGPALYVAGPDLCQADDIPLANIARWNGTHWSAVGSGLPGGVAALASCNFGSGPSLFASSYSELESWNGSGWTLIGASPDGSAAVLALQQFGPYLYVGGSFTHPVSTSGLISTNLARWSPSTGYASVGNPPNAGVNGDVNVLTTFDDGHGLALYAGGSFTIAGSSLVANHVVKWDGTSFSTLGSGTNALVDALTTFDDGTGPALYAGGTFTAAGGVPASCVAKWNGTNWSALRAGLNAQVLTLEVFDDGSGPGLYAGGNFTASGNVPMERIAKWNGTTWSAVGGNIDGTVWTLKSFDDGTGVGAQLFAGGAFHHAGTLPSENFAAWRGCGSTAIARYCFGDGSDGACPCGNFGMAGRGCNNSAATGGARLNATGTTSPDTIVLHAGGEMPNAPTLVFQGSSSLSQPILFGDGMRCVGGNLKRLFTTNAVGGAINVPDVTQIPISARSAALGDPLVPGSVRSYQTWYRDPNLSFCAPPSGDAWNLSNAVRIVW